MTRILLIILVLFFIKGTALGDEELLTNQITSPVQKVRLQLHGYVGQILSGSLSGLGATLSPKPDGLIPGLFGLEIDYFVIKDLGLALGWDFAGFIVSYKSGVQALNIAALSKVYGGVLKSIPLTSFEPLGGSDLGLELNLRAGLSFNFFQTTSEYRALFPGYSFYEGFAIGLGYYGGALVVCKWGSFTAGTGLQLSGYYYRYETSSPQFEMINLEFPITLGIDF